MDRIDKPAVYRKLALLMGVYLILGVAFPVLLMLRTSHAEAAQPPRATHRHTVGSSGLERPDGAGDAELDRYPVHLVGD